MSVIQQMAALIHLSVATCQRVNYIIYCNFFLSRDQTLTNFDHIFIHSKNIQYRNYIILRKLTKIACSSPHFYFCYILANSG